MALVAALLSSFALPSIAEAAPDVRRTKSKRGKVRFDVSKLTINQQRALSRAAPHPKHQAEIVKLLRELARKRGGSSATAAKAILARIDALPRAKKTAALGRSPTRGKRGKSNQPGATAPAFGSGNPLLGLGMLTANLPAETLAPQTSYTLQTTGVRVNTASEGDGDEVVAVAAYAHVMGMGYAHQVAAITGPDALSMQTGDAHAHAADVHVGKRPGLAISAVFEHDGTDGNRAAELEVMLTLAEQLAAQQPGTNKLGNLAFALDQTAGVLSLSDPDGWPAGTVAATLIPAQADPASLAALYATPKTTEDGIDYKLSNHHEIEGGDYQVFFTVLAPEPTAKRVTVKLERIDVLAGVDPGADQDDLVVGVSIGDDPNGSWLRSLPADRDHHNNIAIVRRPMVSSQVPIKIWLRDVEPNEESGEIYGMSSAPAPSPCAIINLGCPESSKAIDVSPSAKTEQTWQGNQQVPTPIELSLDVATGQISGDVSGKTGDALSSKGNMRSPRARIRFRVTVEQP